MIEMIQELLENYILECTLELEINVFLRRKMFFFFLHLFVSVDIWQRYIFFIYSIANRIHYSNLNS